MILPVYLYGSSVLRQKAQDITPDYPHLDKLIGDMWDTLYYADGVGLAAPQIGLSVRIFMVDGSELAEDRPELKDFKRLVINPRIIETSPETVVYQEGCLSLPKLWADIERPKSVKMAYLNRDFEPVEEWFHGMASGWSSMSIRTLKEALHRLAPAIRKKMLRANCRPLPG